MARNLALAFRFHGNGAFLPLAVLVFAFAKLQNALAALVLPWHAALLSTFAQEANTCTKWPRMT